MRWDLCYEGSLEFFSFLLFCLSHKYAHTLARFQFAWLRHISSRTNRYISFFFPSLLLTSIPFVSSLLFVIQSLRNQHSRINFCTMLIELLRTDSGRKKIRTLTSNRSGKRSTLTISNWSNRRKMSVLKGSVNKNARDPNFKIRIDTKQRWRGSQSEWQQQFRFCSLCLDSIRRIKKKSYIENFLHRRTNNNCVKF